MIEQYVVFRSMYSTPLIEIMLGCCCRLLEALTHAQQQLLFYFIIF